MILIITYVLLGQFHSDLQTIIVPGMRDTSTCQRAATMIINQLNSTKSVNIADVKTSCIGEK